MTSNLDCTKIKFLSLDFGSLISVGADENLLAAARDHKANRIQLDKETER